MCLERLNKANNQKMSWKFELFISVWFKSRHLSVWAAVVEDLCIEDLFSDNNDHRLKGFFFFWGHWCFTKLLYNSPLLISFHSQRIGGSTSVKVKPKIPVCFSDQLNGMLSSVAMFTLTSFVSGAFISYRNPIPPTILQQCYPQMSCYPLSHTCSKCSVWWPQHLTSP